MGGASMVYNMGIKKVFEYAGASLYVLLLMDFIIVTTERRDPFYSHRSQQSKIDKAVSKVQGAAQQAQGMATDKLKQMQGVAQGAETKNE